MIRKPSIAPGYLARRGFSIIELMVAITLIAMTLGTCAVTLKLLMRLNGDGQARLSAAIVQDRLARQLREDVHACETAQLAAPDPVRSQPASLRLTFEPDHVIAYLARPGSVVRDESRAGKKVRHESYSLPRDRVARFEQRDEGTRRLVALVVSHVPGKSGIDPPRALEVVASPGKHRALLLRERGGQP